MPYRTPDEPRKQRRLPMLERLTVKTPCNASWEAMVGDDRVRHCCQCNRNVYDLTAMPTEEAEAFLDEQLATTGALPCARLYRRPDGRVMTSQCPTAVDRRHRRRATAAIAGAAVAATVAAHAIIMHVPLMIEDDPFSRDRVGFVEKKVEPMMIMTMGAIVERSDEDGPEVAEEPSPVPDVLIAGNVTLRSYKSPLERIARGGR